MNSIFYSQDKKGLYVVLLILVVFLTFFPSLFNEYVNWDDGPHFLENPCVQRPLSRGSVACAFEQFVNDSYVPLTTVSFIFERHFFGHNPFVSHLINLIFHVCVVLLVFCVLLSLGCSLSLAFITALIFGIHPMRVESVVWVTERKDVLYALFYFASVLVYLSYIQMKECADDVRRRLKALARFLLVLALAGCAILSKPMALTLPFVLILIDWFIRRKWSVTMVLEKCLAGAVVWPVAWWTYQLHVEKAMAVSVWKKILVVIWSAAFYIRKMLFPKLLVAVYDFPGDITLNTVEYRIACVIFIMMAVLIYLFRKNRWVVFGIAFYACTGFYLWGIGTTIGKAHIVADRFMYVPSIGVALVLAVLWDFVFERLKGRRFQRGIYFVVSLTLVSVLILKTISQSFIWKNGIALWAHQYLYEPGREKEKVLSGLMSAIADHMERDILERGDSYAAQVSEQVLQQIYPLDESLETVSKVKILNATARYYYFQGKSDLALRYWKEAINLDSNYYWAFYRMAFVALEQGKQGEALRLLETAAARAPIEDRLFQEKVLAAVTEYRLSS